MRSFIKRLAYKIIERDVSNHIIPSDYVSALESEVLDYVRMTPGLRCYQIDKRMGLNTHHQWITKGVLHNLEDQGRINVIKLGRFPRYYATNN